MESDTRQSIHYAGIQLEVTRDPHFMKKSGARVLPRGDACGRLLKDLPWNT